MLHWSTAMPFKWTTATGEQIPGVAWTLAGLPIPAAWAVLLQVGKVSRPANDNPRTT